MLTTPAMAWDEWGEKQLQQERRQDERQLKYNSFERTWSYQEPDATLQYNPHEQRWQYRQPGEQPKYNPYSGEWK